MAALGRRRLTIIIVAAVVLVLAATALVIVLTRSTSQPTPAAPPAASGSPTASPTASTPTGSASPVPTSGRPSTPGAPPTSSAPPKQPTATARPPLPPMALPPNLRGQDIERIPTQDKVVALTFDAGANDAGLASILSTLAAQHVPATFFLTGAWAKAHPADVAQIAAGGHRVGNHSMTHPDMTTLTDAQIAAELSSAQAAIRADGVDPRPFFRFPSGARNARTIAAVNASGYAAIRWTVDSLGWQGTVGGTRGAPSVIQRVMNAIQPGEIVLMHVGSNPDDGSTLDAAALPGIIDQMRTEGYTFVTLDALI
ncbi:peptidoglycan/xylan/chitin deacetylase (PgdA/CDA1 family) [Sinomonas atrocyanea]|uniref:polysaccharide deacetylase family protein n=1 Tax=Sinomonas atrocyanea TaxID=37927 RepID=UPI00278283FA|nr:polysaccharide deacetylase family protein [Sinomonas atrocyanea]MDP9884846.1 peptidoglycan/xylan/chitin deacetylase (PgdA/CDA1 family) [Sinomonas atrocyanea]